MLDELDRALVHALQLDGRAAFSRIAAVLGVSDQTVARRYRRLREAGSVRVLGLPHPDRLGLVQWYLRIQCTPDAASSVAAALARRDDTAWVTLLSGGTEIGCSVRTSRRAEGEALLLGKLPRTPKVVAVTAHHILHTYFGGPAAWPGTLEALTPEQAASLGRPPAEDRGEPVAVHPGDDRLFAALALDGRAGHAELAAATGWSQTTVRRRMEQLRGTGALYFEVDVDSAEMGHQTVVTMWMSVPPGRLDAVARELADHPEIAFVAATTGPTNLMATVICRDERAFHHYLTRRIGALEAVRHLETAPRIRCVKREGRLLPSLRG